MLRCRLNALRFQFLCKVIPFISSYYSSLLKALMSDCYSLIYYFLINVADNDNGLTEFVYTIYRMARTLFFTDTEQCMSRSVAPAGPATNTIQLLSNWY